MGAQFYKDDNAQALVDPAGLRPVFAASGLQQVTTAAGIVEQDISALNVAANRNERGDLLVSLTVVGNHAYVAFGAAGTPPGSNASMLLISTQNARFVIRLSSSDVSMYTQQITGAGTVQLAVLK